MRSSVWEIVPCFANAEAVLSGGTRQMVGQGNAKMGYEERRVVLLAVEGKL